MTVLENLRAFLAARSVRAYLVGGTVRDLLLERETHDLDIAVEAEASTLARAFADESGGAFFLMDDKFDVARVILDRGGAREVIDFARLRGASINDDLGSRDFTVNAMAVEIAGPHAIHDEIIDPFGGRADVRARRLRAISDQVFRTDAVRLLRAARIESELDFALDFETEQLVRSQAAAVETAPQERVREEFMRIVGAEHPLRNLRRLDGLDLLRRVLPELNALRGVSQSPPHIYDVFEHTLFAVEAAQVAERAGYSNIAQGAFAVQLSEHFARPYGLTRTRRELLRLALLLHDVGKPATRAVEADGRIRFIGHEKVGAKNASAALRRLKFSNDEIGFVRTIVANHLRPILLANSGVTDRAVYRFFRDTGDFGVDTVIHACCDQRATYGFTAEDGELAASQAVAGRLLDRYYHAHRKVIAPPALVDGNELMAYLKLPPGPRVGELLEALREAQATGQVTSHADALEFLRQMHAS